MKRRMVSILTALALVLSLCPTWAFATEADPALCKHHLEHTEDCGYIAPTEGQPCGHEHGDECYSEETVCGHDHDESCYSDGQLPAEGEDKAADVCAHACSAESGCVTRTLDCQHVHNEECGYVEDDPGTPCGYACRICPIEALIDALPGKVTEENRADVEARLQEILGLYGNLPDADAEQVDISRCLELQEALDEASVPELMADDVVQVSGDITINRNHDGKTLTSNGNPQKGSIFVSGITVSLTISDLNLEGTSRSAIVLEDGANLTLNLQGTNNLEGGGTAAGIKVPAGCTLTITGGTGGSLRVLGGDGAAGIGASVYNGGSTGTVQTVGTIIINSGNITATGLGGGPGIGGTVKCTTGDVIINGGNITASGSSGSSFFGAAGIGAGYVGHLNSITITGGTVKATGMSRDDVGVGEAAGIGAGPYPLSGSSVPIGCGDISITGGTILNTTIGFGADSLANKTHSGSVTIQKNVDLPGCSVKPMPQGWNSYTFSFKVFDTSITDGETPAQFVVRGRTYDVTIQRDTSQPYCGAFSLKDVLLPVDGSDEVQLILNGKTLTKTVSFSNTAVNADFGAQEHAYYSLDITIYDEKITDSMDATVQIGGQTVTGRLNKTVEYCGTMTIERIILPIGSGDAEQEVTVTAGGSTWTGTASEGRSKTLTIGSPIQPAQASFDLSYGDITFEESGGAVTVTYHDGAGAKTYQLTDLSKVYEVTQSNAGTATANRLIIRNMSEPVHIRIKDINIATETNSPIDITNGKAILETSGTNTVTASGETFAGVHVGSGSELTLAGTGQLTAKSTHSTYSGAGIGSDKGKNSGKIVIQSGTVIAESAMYGAGIGSGRSGSGTVTINGGTVTATGGSSSDNGLSGGAGIGGGSGGFGTVTINGGTVTATGTGSGNGIGAGSSAGANVTITGGTVHAKSGDRGSGIGGSGQSSRIDIHISGGIITADATGSEYGSGIGSGTSGTATIKISGGTIKASAHTSSLNRNSGIGSGHNGSATVTITGGTIQASGRKSAVENPKDENSTALSLVTITLDGVGDNVPVTGVSGTGSYGCKDVYTRDGGKLYFYLPENTRPEKITAGGVDYVPDSAGSTNYVVDFQVSFTGYELTKEYDGTPMQKPTADQVTSNGKNLIFAWYQNNIEMGSAPVNAGSYTLRVSSDKGSKDFDAKITKRPLTITAQAQTIDYGTNISQAAYTSSELAAGDTLTVTLAASETAAGTYTGAITISSAAVMRSSTDVTGNYEITSTPGDLTINKAALTVNSWPAAGAITYGQALSASTLAGGSASTAGTFAWKDGTAKPSAGTAEYDVIFTPDNPNYEAVTGKVPVTVQKAALTVKANDQSITYGGSIQTGVGQVTAAPVNGDTLTAVTVSAVAANAGTYTDGITVTGAKIGNNGTDVTANYEISYGAGDLTISPLAITVTPNSGQSKEYGAADPVLKYTVTPALIGDDKLTGALTYEGTDVGKYEITRGTLTAGNNYTLTVASGVKFTITKLSLATAKVTLDNASFTYDGTAKTPAVTVTKGGSPVNVDEYDISYSNTNGGAGDNIHAGTVTVTVIARADGNYSGTNSTATFTIDPKVLTPVIVGTTTKTYDGTTNAPADLSIALTGAVDGDIVTATASYAYDNKNAGEGKVITASGITLGGASKANYTLSTTSATTTGTITKATVSITWGNTTQTVDYSGTQATITPPTVSAESGVTVNAAPKYSYAGQGSTEFTSGLPTNAGTYTVRASIAASDNLTAAHADMTLTISPAALTVTPDSGQSKEYGAADPALTYTITSGKLYGTDTLMGALAYSGTNVGEYEITQGTLTAGNNYTLIVASGVKFTITKLSLATAVVTLDNASFTYDGTAKTPAVTVKKGESTVAAGEYEISYTNSNGGAGDHTYAGAVTVTVTAKDSGNYSGSNSAAVFTITPKELTPTITGTTTKTYDGTTSAPAGLSITLDGKVGSDDVTATAASYTYDSPNVKGAKKITASGITLGGTAIENYVLKSNTAEIAATITKDTSATAPATGEGYTLDYPQETISLTDGYEVSTANDGSGSTVPKGSITDHLGKTLYIRKVEDDNHAASGWTAFTLAARPDAPSLTKTDETLKGQKNGNLSGTTTAMEYSVDGGKTWTACPGTALENLSGGAVVQVRVKATTAAPCGAVSSHTIAEGKPITVTFDSQGGSTIEARSGLTYGSKMEKPADPAREDYEFQGWYKETGCTTEWNFVSDTLTAENVTLYAKWKKVRFSVGGTVTGNDGNSVVGGATVTLMKGSEQIDQGTTKDDGGFTFTKHVAAGAYNIVTTYAPEGKAQQIKTTLITLSDDDMTEVAVTLPPEGANSQLTVTKNSDTPAVVVGGLDEEAATLKTGDVSTVTVSMEVEGKKETQVDKSVAGAIKEKIKTESSTDKPVVEYLDITVTKQVNSGSKEEVTQTTKVIEIVVPFSFSGRDNIVVVRYHDGKAEKLQNANTKADGTYQTDAANGYIYIYTNQFSTYAVGYTASYTITFDANGGTLTETTSTTSSQGTLSSLPANPSRKGYTFKGWYTAASGGTQVTTSTVFKADTTVYAQWQQNSSGGNTPAGGGGGGGGWSGVTTYAVTVSSPTHGKVTASPVNATSGGTVTLTVTPDSGYVLDTLTVTDSRGDQVKLTDKGHGKYTFTMPSRAVTVKAVFIPIPDGTACDGGADCPSRGFTDLGTVGTWYHEAVDYALQNGLMGGYGEGLFGPNDTLSRAQLAQVLHNKEGRPIVNYLLRFDDVPSGAWYTEAIRWAASTGIVGGYGNGKYGPGDNITREQLAVMLWRYAGSPAATDRELHFADANEASDWAEEALRWAAEKGIINGKGGGILDPQGPASRAQAAQMLMNFLKK